MTEIYPKQAPKGTYLFMKVVSAVVEVLTRSCTPRPFTLAGRRAEATGEAPGLRGQGTQSRNHGMKHQDSGTRRDAEQKPRDETPGLGDQAGAGGTQETGGS